MLTSGVQVYTQWDAMGLPEIRLTRGDCKNKAYHIRLLSGERSRELSFHWWLELRLYINVV